MSRSNFLKQKYYNTKTVFEYIIIAVLIIYSVVTGSLISYISNSLFDSFQSISLPNGAVKITLIPGEPYIELPFRINNKGIFNIDEFWVNVSLHLSYQELLTDKEINKKIFQKDNYYEKIQALTSLEDIIYGQKTDFNVTQLINYAVYANASFPPIFLLNVRVSGFYYFKSVPFNFELRDIVLY